MDLLQYSFDLAADHRMDEVRARVAAKRHLLDDLPGLHWKAWLLSEPWPGRSQPRSYAPLYLFDDVQSTLAFLRGALYRGVTDAFGWTAPFHGPAVDTPAHAPVGAQSCALQTTPLRDHAALLGASQGAPRPEGALLVARQFDVSRMQLRTYTFWGMPPQALHAPDAERIYEVVALSAPHGGRR